MSLDLRDSFRERFDLGYEDSGSSLGGVRQGTTELDHPEKEFQSVHVTGSKGSSSTCAFIGKTLQNAGYTVGLFSGQKVTDLGVREKFRIDDEYITESEFWSLAERVISQVETRDEWDVLVLMALKYFAEQDVDVAVIEAGVGGATDSTNVVSAELSIITNAVVTPNHPGLGDTDIEVAENKAGIIHHNAVVVSNGTREVNQRIQEITEGRNGKFSPTRQIVSFERDDRRFIATYEGHTVPTQIVASYLCENINTAMTGLVDSEFEVPIESTLQSLREFSMPGRCELVGQNPEFVIDGGSNGFSARVVRDEMESIGNSSVLIFGGIKDEDGWMEVLDELHAEEKYEHIIVPDCTHVGLVDPQIIGNYIDCEIVPTASTAIGLARELSTNDEIVVCTGSLYLAQQVRLALLDDF